MIAERLLRLYPRAWRDRYGEEFLATVGPGPLGLQQAIDIVCGAIDAWLSPDVRRATAAASGGGSMTTKTWTMCERTPMRYGVRDGLMAAAVMIAVTAIVTTLGGALTSRGWPETGGALRNFGFLGSLALSMPFWITKGQPWKAQAVIVGGMIAFLVAIAWL